ncbi:hypothetical protein MTP99_002069 [Tenebrio molitor]|nr:hypothetical protein MTP99_002069 [Tenebrio molitor]
MLLAHSGSSRCRYKPTPHTRLQRTKSIIEEIKEAAELATQNSGFVYDECSGMYYDANSGYYYNADYGLYYEPSSCTYLKYKADTNTYEFHSRPFAALQESFAQEIVKRKKKKLGTDSSHSFETEEGECSITSGNDSSDDNRSDTSDVTRKWPPCMRIIVEQSQHQKIRVGSLHIVTCEGGTLGREGDHAIILPDINISKCHLRFAFDKSKNLYFVTDLGSRNRTVLNGKRMCASKQESEAMEVAHGSRIQVGSVVLLCHVHDGTKTCGLCEPGLVQTVEKKVEQFPKGTKSEQHKNELKKLRKKFGVRLRKRRETVGSQNPHEKTEVASINEAISPQNKGFKMLAKMGWKEGQSLGKDSQGIVEPVRLISNPGTSGMGNTEIVNSTQSDKNKQFIWKKTQERFKKLPASTIFEDSD